MPRGVKVPGRGPFRNPATHEPLTVSPQTTDVLIRALVSAHRNGDITDEQYAMAYAEACEPGRLPQVFGGAAVPQSAMDEWTSRVWPR